jgi:ABC-type multidrug transport system fused ATPase/permease subunit
VLLLTGIGLQVVNPQIMRYFVDAATSGGDAQSGVPSALARLPPGLSGVPSALALAALAFIGLAICQQAISVGASYVGENVAWTATNALRAEMARHCLTLDMGFHNNSSPGELIERIDGDVSELANFFSQLVIRVVGNILLLLGVLLALALEDWRLGLAYAVFAGGALYVLNRVKDVAVAPQKAMRAANADLFGFLEERLAGTEDIRSCGAVEFCIRGLYRLQAVILKHWRKAWQMNLIVNFAGGMLMMLAHALAFVGGYYLYRGGLITVGTAYLVLYYTNILGRPIHELTQHVESLQTIGASTDRLADLKAIEPQVVDGPGVTLPLGALSLQFCDVSFAYVADEPVVEGLSFHLEPGRVLGLLGRTGSGKTTLARLLFRLYDPTAGEVRLGGVDIREARVRAVRQRVALVTQDVQLFQATVRDNLTFFSRSIPDERIVRAIEDLELGDWFRSLPQGLDTRLDPGGQGLSAGEAQLLAFTRVFLRDPGLVILDEASSRLDRLTEQRIERAIDKLLRGRTAIIIAHRLGTVQRADDILILEQGRPVEQGESPRSGASPGH